MGEKKKKRWLVVSSIEITVVTEVEAPTPAKAKEDALDRAVMGLCHQCAGDYGKDIRAEWRTSGELDGQPEEILSCEEVGNG